MNNANVEYIEILKKSLKTFPKNFLYLLVSLPVGIIYFTFAICAISLGLGLSITIIGIPIMASTLIFTKKIVDFEKITATKILSPNMNIITGSVELSKGEGMIRGMIGIIKDSRNWRSIFYCIVKLPVSIMHFTAVACLPILSIAFVCQPGVYIVTKLGGIDIYINNITIGDLLGLPIPKSVESILYFIVGIGITFSTIKIINKLAESWANFTLKF